MSKKKKCKHGQTAHCWACMLGTTTLLKSPGYTVGVRECGDYWERIIIDDAGKVLAVVEPDTTDSELLRLLRGRE